MGRRFRFLRNYSRKWRMGMAFVMALVLLFANAGVTSMATELDDGFAQEVSDEDMEITGDDDGSDGEMEMLSDEDEPGEDREITGGADGSDGETEASSDEDEPDENAALYDEEDDADENNSDVDDGVDDAEAVIEESENAYPAEGQDDEENAGAVGGEASDTDDESAAPEEEPAEDGEIEVTDANTAAEEQPAEDGEIEVTDANTASEEQLAADGEIEVTDANVVAEEQPVGNDDEKTDIEEPEVEETETEAPVDSPAFAEEEIIDGVKVTVTAAGEVFPEGSSLSVRKVSGREEKSVSAAVEDAKGNGGNEEKIAASYTFDIKVLDKDGNEIEPDEKKGSVSVSFALDEVENQNLAAEVWHITGETGGLNAEALDAKTDGETVTAETDGFSYYQVEFTYDGKQYVLPGDESMALTEILADVGITNADGSAAKDAGITAAKGSDDELFTVEKKDGVWTVTAVRAFHTEEWLRVTVDGVEYEIVVTDAEYSSSVSISNLKQGDVLKPGTTISGNMQLAFKDNRHSLTESGPIVDDNIGTQVYNSLKIVSGGAAICGSYTYYPIDDDGNHVDKWVIIYVFTYTTEQPPYFMLGGYSSIAKYSETTSFTYDGTNKSPITDDRNVTIAGTYTEKTAGNYTATVTPKSGCTWSDGTTGTKTVNWSILPQSLTIPTLSNTSFTYKRGRTYKPTVNDYDSKKMTQVPTNLSEYEVGEYTVKWTLKDPTNYQWSDGTNEAKSVIWSIVKADISPTVAMSGWTYGETASEPVLDGDLGYASSVTVTYQYKVKDANDSTYTTIKPSNAGNYTVRATIEERNNYNGGTATANFTISPKSLSIPTLTNTTITYNGSEQSPTVNNYDNSTMNQSGTTSATNVGNYTVTWTLKNTTNYKWSDNTTADKSSSWSIGKASINPTVTLAGWTYCDTAKTPSVTGNPGNGAVTYEYKEQGEADTKYRKEQPSNAGNYTVRATIAETANYNGGTATRDFVIAKRIVTVASGIKAESRLYNGGTNATLDTSGAVFSGIKSGDTLTVSATGRFSDANAGEGKTVEITNLSLGGASAGNYRLASSGNQATATAAIRKRSITLKSDSSTREYNGSALTKDHVTISGDGFVSGEGASYTVTGSQTEVGSSENSFSYTLKEGTDPNNYTINITFGTLTVTRAENLWTTDPSISNWTYGDASAAPVYGATKFGDAANTNVTYKGTGSTNYPEGKEPPVGSGSYCAIFALPGNENYTSISKQIEFTIAQREAGLAWSNLTFTYDGNPHKPTATATHLVEGDTCTVTVEGEKTDQGTYTATASGLSNKNYKLPSANTVSFTIGRASISPTVSLDNWIYGETAADPVVNGNKGGGDVIYKYKASTADDSDYTGAKPTAAGTYTVKATIAQTHNYNGGTATANFTIEKAEPAVTVPTAKTLTYTGSPQELADPGTADGGMMKYSLSKEGDYGTAIPTGTDAGSYTVWYRVVGDKNHNDAAAQSVRITIAPKELAIAAKAQTITYGGAIASGTGQVDTNGLVSGHTLKNITLTPSTTDATTSGTITPDAAKIESDDRDVTANYSIAYQTGALIIEKAEPAVTAPTAKTLTYTGNPQELVDSGEADGGTMKYSLSKEGDYGTAVPTGTDARSYTVWYRVVGDKNHNDAEAQSVSITIAPKELVITAKAQTITYGGAIAAGTEQVDAVGLVSGHTLKSITLTPSTTDATTSGTITPDVAEIESDDTDVTVNYSITYLTGALIIEKAEPAVTAPTAKTLTYTGSPQELADPGIADGGTMEYSLSKEGDYGTAVPTGTDAGSYRVWYRVVGDKNHNDAAAQSVRITIAPKELTITARAQTITYGGAIVSGTGQVDAAGLVSGHTLKSITLTPSTTDATTSGTIMPGAAKIKSNETDVTANYSIDYRTGVLIIEKAESAVTAPTARTLTYTGSTQELVGAGSAMGGMLQYKLDSGSYSKAIPAATDAGGYTVWYRVVGDKNHNDTSPASLHVTIAKAGLSLSVSLEGWTYGTKANAPSITGNSSSGAVAYAYKAKDAEEAGYSPAVPAEAGEYTVKATVAETANYLGGTATASFTIDKAAPVVTAPTAMTLTHNGSPQELVSPGTAKGGTLYYAVTGEKAAPTDPALYTTSIPAKTDAGTYYVWYKAVGDSDHNDTVPACVTAEILAGEIRTETDIAEDVPKSTVNGLTTELAKTVLSESEKKEVESGAKLTVSLEVTNITGSEPGEDKKKTEQAAKKAVSSAKVGMYLDLSLYKQIGNEDRKKISSLNGRTITVTLDVPKSLKAPSGVARTYYLIRVHEGKAEILAKTKKMRITFATGAFSTYAIAYSDAAGKEKTGTSDNGKSRTDSDREGFRAYFGGGPASPAGSFFVASSSGGGGGSSSAAGRPTFFIKDVEYRIISKKKKTAALVWASDRKAMIIPAVIKRKGKTYKVTVIDKRAFKECNSLRKVVIGKNVKRIGAKAFAGCRKLKKIDIRSKKLSMHSNQTMAKQKVAGLPRSPKNNQKNLHTYLDKPKTGTMFRIFHCRDNYWG